MLPFIIAIVAGTAPIDRTTVSTSSAVYKF